MRWFWRCRGVLDLLRQFDLVGDDSEAEANLAEAKADVTSEQPTGAGARKFLAWARDRVVAGVNTAVNAAILTTITGLESDVTHLLRATGHA
jgi:hypothetical protein